jgi:hypothetical protein
MEVSETDSESSQPQDAHASAQKIIGEIKALEKELTGIQISCGHPKYTVKNCQRTLHTEVSPLEGSVTPVSLDLGYPTQPEVDKWMNS